MTTGRRTSRDTSTSRGNIETAEPDDHMFHRFELQCRCSSYRTENDQGANIPYSRVFRGVAGTLSPAAVSPYVLAGEGS